jgi:hypothetical protein
MKTTYSLGEAIEVGLDEAGRGCFWGPIFAGAVIWPPEEEWTEEYREIAPHIKDSKTISEKKRTAIANSIRGLAIDWGVGQVDASEIDEHGMTWANQEAFRRAMAAFSSGLEPDILLIDGILGSGSGYGICYRILKSILNELPISLKYEDLYDPITRLKETFDFYRQQVPGRQCNLIWGNMLWENIKTESGQIVNLYQHDKLTNRKKLLITTEAPLLDEAKQQAASKYLQALNDYGFKRPIPEYYARINSVTSEQKKI